MLKEEVLVSIIVPTYNSCKTIIETLDSIYEQTYKNIELIITDDHSNDDTVTVCENWINKHQKRFESSKIITSPINTGTAGNLNRALKKTTGIWCKIIAGDDHLLPHCIEQFLSHVENKPKQRIVFAKVKGFGNMEAAENWPFKNVTWLFANLSHRDMKILLTQDNFLPAASAFIRKDVYDQIGGYDESIPLLEDWPFWVKAVFNGINLYFYDEYVAEYRFSITSISHMSHNQNLSPNYIKSLNKSVSFAHNHLKHVSLFMHFYTWTRYLKYKGSIIGKFLYLFNIINPDHYKFKTTMKKFNYFKTHHLELE